MSDDKLLTKFKSNDINECLFILSIVRERFDRRKRKIHSDEIDRYIDCNIDELSKIINSYDIEHSELNQLKKDYQVKSKVVNSNFEWIKSNIEAAFFLWFSIKLNVSTDEERRRFFIYRDDVNYNQRDEDNEDIQELFRSNPLNINNVVSDLLIFYFTFLDKESQLIQLLDDIKNNWLEVNKKSRLKWIDSKNKEQCDWAYSYLIEKTRFFNDNFLAHPENKFLFTKTFFNVYVFHIGVKYIFLEMNKAWNQRRYRESRADKKALSGYISADAKTKLTNLAKKARMPEYELLELLILEQYDREKIKR
ncbi:Uncharacterised protein [Yersinia frederiksenii]|nr:Uncharacterised protein [Yersinia frederiksenii]